MAHEKVHLTMAIKILYDPASMLDATVEAVLSSRYLTGESHRYQWPESRLRKPPQTLMSGTKQAQLLLIREEQEELGRFLEALHTRLLDEMAPKEER